MSRGTNAVASSPENNGRCQLKVSLTIREWKKAYFGDRPPRLSIKLLNPPPMLDSLTLQAFTSFVGKVPVITTKKKTIVCERKSHELHVKQMHNPVIKCMKSWAHCLNIRGREINSGQHGDTIVRCSTNKAINSWMKAVEQRTPFEGAVWLKPDDEKMYLRLKNDVLMLLRKSDADKPVRQWRCVDGQTGHRAITVGRYFKRVVLDRSNNFHSIVSFSFQTGRYGAQVFNIEPMGSHPPCEPYQSPVFSVTSCNRHPPRSPLLQAQENAALAAQHARAKKQHAQMLLHQRKNQNHKPVKGLLNMPLVMSLGNRTAAKSGGQTVNSLSRGGRVTRPMKRDARSDVRKPQSRASKSEPGSSRHGTAHGQDRYMDKKLRIRARSYVDLAGNTVHRDGVTTSDSTDNRPVQQRPLYPQHQQFGSDVEEQLRGRLESVSFSEDGGRGMRTSSSAGSLGVLTDLASPHGIPNVTSSGSLASMGGIPSSISMESLDHIAAGGENVLSTGHGNFVGAYLQNQSPAAGRSEDDVVNALFALNGSSSRGGNVSAVGSRGIGRARNRPGQRPLKRASPDQPAAGNSPAQTFKPPAEWLPDNSVKRCCTSGCAVRFGLLQRRHHCRVCGKIFCKNCCPKRQSYFGNRVCGDCANTLPGAEGGAATSAIGLVAGAHHLQQQLYQRRKQHRQPPLATHDASFDFDGGIHPFGARQISTGNTQSYMQPSGTVGMLSNSEHRLSGPDLFSMGLSSGGGSSNSLSSIGGNGNVTSNARFYANRNPGSNGSMDLVRLFNNGSRTNSHNSLSGLLIETDQMPVSEFEDQPETALGRQYS